jgi:hypothetical protein
MRSEVTECHKTRNRFSSFFLNIYCDLPNCGWSSVTFIFPSCKNLALRLIFLQLSTYLQTNIKMAGLLGGGGGNNNGNGGGGLLGG